MQLANDKVHPTFHSWRPSGLFNCNGSEARFNWIYSEQRISLISRLCRCIMKKFGVMWQRSLFWFWPNLKQNFFPPKLEGAWWKLQILICRDIGILQMSWLVMQHSLSAWKTEGMLTSILSDNWYMFFCQKNYITSLWRYQNVIDSLSMKKEAGGKVSVFHFVCINVFGWLLPIWGTRDIFVLVCFFSPLFAQWLETKTVCCLWHKLK